MKLLLSCAVLGLTLGVLRASPEDPPEGVSEDTLKQLSVDGERLVDEEVRRALHGVKQMKEVMWRNEQKHEHLMTSLRHSSDKKKGAAQLAKEVREKLVEAEEQCQESLQPQWEACRPCLEHACKAFYTSTCRRGFASFQAKVENFFRRVSRRFGPREARVAAGDVLVNQDAADGAGADAELVRVEDAFGRLAGRVGALVERSAALASRMSGRMRDAALLTALLNGTGAAVDRAAADPYDPGRDSGFLQGVGLEEVMDSFLDFGRSVMEEFGAVVTQVFDDLHEAVDEERQEESTSSPRVLHSRRLCRDLRRQSSECWQLQSRCESCQGALLTGEAPPTECPAVRELHVELDEVSQLLDVSREQYDEILSIVRRHTAQTVGWLGDMAARFGWVAQALSGSSAGENVFRVTMVAPKSRSDLNDSVTETRVEVNVLNSSPIAVSVPGELELLDPVFIQYVAQEALDKYKEMVRFEDE